MSRRLGILLALGGVVLAIAGVAFVAVIFRQAMAPPPAPTQAPAITVPVVVTTRALPIRSLLSAADLTVVNMPVEFAPLGAVSEVDAAVGQIAMIGMASGEIVMRHHLADPTNTTRNFGFIIEDDQVLMAFPSNDLMSQVDVLQPGDLVDIFVSLEVPVLPEDLGLAADPEAEPQTQLFTFNALQRVAISAIVVEVTAPRQSGSAASLPGDDVPPTPTPNPQQIQAHAILLALDPQDALVLKHLKDQGALVDIVLRSPTANQNFEVDPVTGEYLKDRYELVEEP